MAIGHPDYLTWAGRSGGGAQVLPYSFSAAIPAGATGTFNLPVVDAGTENTYQCIMVSARDDTALHFVSMSVPAMPWIWFMKHFVTGGIFDFPGHLLPAGVVVRVSITNHAAVALTFYGVVFWTRRNI